MHSFQSVWFWSTNLESCASRVCLNLSTISSSLPTVYTFLKTLLCSNRVTPKRLTTSLTRVSVIVVASLLIFYTKSLCPLWKVASQLLSADNCFLIQTPAMVQAHLLQYIPLGPLHCTELWVPWCFCWTVPVGTRVAGVTSPVHILVASCPIECLSDSGKCLRYS